MIDILFGTPWGVQPSGVAQAATFVGGFLLAAAGLAIMWLRERN